MIRVANLHTLRRFSYYVQESQTFYMVPNHRPQLQCGPSLTELQAKHLAKATPKQQFSQEYIYTTELILTHTKKVPSSQSFNLSPQAS